MTDDGRDVRLINGPAAGRVVRVSSNTPIRYAEDPAGGSESWVTYDIKPYPDGSWIGSIGTETFTAVMAFTEQGREDAREWAIREWHAALRRQCALPVGEQVVVVEPHPTLPLMNQWRVVGEATR